MNRFAENLSQLRRKAGYTQESLAEAMGVSRQAVGKWESGQAMPEAATLMELSDLLGCSLDALMREELPPEDPQTDGTAPAGPTEEEWALFLEHEEHINRFAAMIAGGVGLVLLGVAGLLFLSARLGETPLVILPLFACLAAAVFLFISGGIAHDAFEKAHPSVPDFHTPEERAAFARRFQIGMAGAVAGILADVAFLVVLVTFREGDRAAAWAVGVFMSVLAVCVGAIVYLGIQKSAMDGTMGSPQPDDPRSGVIMSLATALFLFFGFVFHAWHPAWVVFPIGGILCGALNRSKRS